MKALLIPVNLVLELVTFFARPVSLALRLFTGRAGRPGAVCGLELGGLCGSVCDMGAAYHDPNFAV